VRGAALSGRTSRRAATARPVGVLPVCPSSRATTRPRAAGRSRWRRRACGTWSGSGPGAPARPRWGSPPPLRAWFATHLVAETGDLAAVQDLLGHESADTTAL